MPDADGSAPERRGTSSRSARSNPGRTSRCSFGRSTRWPRSTTIWCSWSPDRTVGVRTSSPKPSVPPAPGTASGASATCRRRSGSISWPVVASAAGSLPEVLGDAAVLVDPHDVDALGGALARVLEEPQLRDDLVRRGLERAGGYQWEIAVDEMLSLYGSLL